MTVCLFVLSIERHRAIIKYTKCLTQLSDKWNAHCTRNWLVILARVLLISFQLYAYALPNNQLVINRQAVAQEGGLHRSQQIRQLEVRSQESSVFPQGLYYVFSYALSFSHFNLPKICTRYKTTTAVRACKREAS